MLLTRRSLIGILAAPAIIRVADIMAVKAYAETTHVFSGVNLGTGDVCYMTAFVNGELISLPMRREKNGTYTVDIPMGKGGCILYSQGWSY